MLVEMGMTYFVRLLLLLFVSLDLFEYETVTTHLVGASAGFMDTPMLSDDPCHCELSYSPAVAGAW
jgi:hypothetical protein